jgi:hypothetical protein
MKNIKKCASSLGGMLQSGSKRHNVSGAKNIAYDLATPASPTMNQDLDR